MLTIMALEKLCCTCGTHKSEEWSRNIFYSPEKRERRSQGGGEGIVRRGEKWEGEGEEGSGRGRGSTGV